MNIVLFDGVCNLCSKTVLFLTKFDKKNNLHFAAQQTNAGAKIMNQYLLDILYMIGAISFIFGIKLLGNQEKAKKGNLH